MSALFHIPQQDSPTFKADNWSPELVSFLEACVHKQPEKRSTALQLLEVSFATFSGLALASPGLCQHPFLADGATKSMAAVNSLISRSLGAVREEIDLPALQSRLEIGETGPASRTTPPIAEDVGSLA
jgi:serine/threonine protein kinase